MSTKRQKTSHKSPTKSVPWWRKSLRWKGLIWKIDKKKLLFCFQNYKYYARFDRSSTSRRCAGLSMLLGWDKFGNGRFSSSASASVHFFDCFPSSFTETFTQIYICCCIALPATVFTRYEVRRSSDASCTSRDDNIKKVELRWGAHLPYMALGPVGG